MSPVAVIKKRGGKYHLISHEGKTLGVHKTREGALKQEQAIEISKRKAEITDAAKLLAENIREFIRDDVGRFATKGGSNHNGKQPHWVAPPSKEIK